ncbi:ThiJ/PfpI domain-containing protein [Coccomyxa subellipsoidea C-169]|uniref:ThiJ/PfpI domain-containing protein n=1 Tax=Coccomyxa subellipsoidea (strain C-169) TaxID=574566 RepID=I0Z6H6_COCSC|nr:ThiJ/PfpI domain-containing protein [Coccomyxa subellipsoidea C-169]EIE26245.1 ThiJ/PfpI domain-containing protein [Coccomyxa subellipsoidea C-169]|eukprot:XP_005650789.1 ThiJ/PfpI domain-containing protein [Coccomyxa subellipsoidea C-169]
MGRPVFSTRGGSDSILIVATSETTLGETLIPTGAWAETIAEPYYTFRRKGYRVVMASIRGGPIPIDPASVAPQNVKTHTVKLFLADPEAQRLMHHSLPVALVDSQDYGAIFISGMLLCFLSLSCRIPCGHGIAWDGPFNKELRRLVEEAYATGKIIAAVDHGPAAIVHARNIKLGDPREGTPLVFRKDVTGFSNTEEEAVRRAALVPFLLEDRIRDEDGIYVRALRDFDPYAVRTGQLITGQNWQSSKATADLVVDALSFGVRNMP